VNSQSGKEFIEAIKFGDSMADKIIDNMESEAEEAENSETEDNSTTEKTGDTDKNGGNGNKNETKPPEKSPETPPADDGVGGNPDAGYMTQEEIDALNEQDWNSNQLKIAKLPKIKLESDKGLL